MQRSAASIVALLGACAFILPTTADAQVDANEADYQRAAQARAQAPEEALAIFRAIHERTGAPRALVQVAILEAQLGRWLAAEEHLRAALEAPADAWVAQRRATLDATLGEIRTHVSELVVVVANVPGARLRVNGADAGTLPLARGVRVTVGQVLIDVEAPGYEPLRQPVQTTAGHTRVELVLVPVVAAPAPTEPLAPPTPPTRSPGVRAQPPSLVGPIVLFGVGGAALGASLGLYVRQSELVRGCDVQSDAIYCETNEQRTSALQAHGYGVGGLVSLLVGGASLGVATVWTAVALSAPRSGSRAAIVVTPETGPGVLGARVSGAF